MRRPLRRAQVLTLGLGLALLAAPAALGMHPGPCIHEYAEIALHVALTRDVRGGLSDTVGCVEGTPGWICPGCIPLP